jgi:RNA-directed DNA polymerase
MQGSQVHKAFNRKRRGNVGQGVGGGHSTVEARDKRVEGRAAASIMRTKDGKVAGLHPRGQALSQPLDKTRKLQRSLYRTAKQQPKRRFTLLIDKIRRKDLLLEAWQRVRKNGGAAGIDRQSIAWVDEYGAGQFVEEIKAELDAETYRSQPVRRVFIPKPGQPGKVRPLGIPTLRDRVVQMAVKLVIEPLFEADFRACSYGFRPLRTPRQALSEIAKRTQAGFEHVVDVDLKSYFDTIDHQRLMALVERRVGDIAVLRLIRGWLKAGVMEEGKITHADKGTPQGGVISPLLSNIMLHEVDAAWCDSNGQSLVPGVVLVRYADDMVLLAKSAVQAQSCWLLLQQQFHRLGLVVNSEKSKLTTLEQGFAFLGFEFRKRKRLLYMWPRKKAQLHLHQRTRDIIRNTHHSQSFEVLVKNLNPVLTGWCTYFRVGNSNRVFHNVDWFVRNRLHAWLKRKHACRLHEAQRRWNHHAFYNRLRLYRLVGKVSHLEGLRKPT